MKKSSQVQSVGASAPAIPERVSVAMTEPPWPSCSPRTCPGWIWSR